MLTECFYRDVKGGCIPECRACDDCKGKAYKLIDREHLIDRIHKYVDTMTVSNSFSESFLDIMSDTAFDIIKMINAEYVFTLYDDRGENNE